MVLPDSGIAGNSAPLPPANGGISDMLFFPDTHELLWLEGGRLLRSWMDKTQRRELAVLPGDANVSELLNVTGNGPSLGSHGEDGAIAWTQQDSTAVILFASLVTKKLWIASLSSIPPREPSHVGPWLQVPGATIESSKPDASGAPLLLASDGTVYWTDALHFRSWTASAALQAASENPTSQSAALANLTEWGEVLLAQRTGDGGLLWVRRPPTAARWRLELILRPDLLHLGPNDNLADENVRSLHEFLEGDLPSGLAVPPNPGPGLPYRGNLTRLFQQVYWSISGPETQARIDHLDMETGKISTLSYAAGLERRGAMTVRPGALSIYPMPEVCVNVGCLYLRVWEECRICTEDQCDTCFLDTQDWVVKQWYSSHGLFSNCLWLWPADQAAWFVRTEVQQAKEKGLLPDDFVAQELPPEGATPPSAVATVPPTVTITTATPTATASTSTFTMTSTTSTSMTLSMTNPCIALEPPEGLLPDETCSDMVNAWCQDLSINSSMPHAIAPSTLRRDCATYPWTFKALCNPQTAPTALAPSNCEQPLWSYALLAAGIALILSTIVPFFWCASMRRRRGRGTVSDLPSGLRLREAAWAEKVPGRGASNLAPSASEQAESGHSTKTPWWDFRQRWNAYVKRSKQSKRCCCRRHERILKVESPEKSWEVEQVDTETPPDTTMSIGSPRPSADDSVPPQAASVQQILKGTWQPGLSTLSAAAAAGRLTDAMRKFMLPGARQADKWRLLHDVEDILRTLGSALPANLRSAAWAWHARQTGRLHRSSALETAQEEARSIAEDFREDLSRRLQNGVRQLEATALEGIDDVQDFQRAPGPKSLQKALKLQDALEKLKIRMEQVDEGDSSINAAHLLDCYQTLMRLKKDAEKSSANDGAGQRGPETSNLWDALAQEIGDVQEALQAKLEESGVPSGSLHLRESDEDENGTGGQGGQQQSRKPEAQGWLKGLKDAARRAATFAQKLKELSRKDKEKLEEMEKKLLAELESCEDAAARAGGDSRESTNWRQLQNSWSQLRDELEQVRQAPEDTGEKRGGRLSSWARGRSKMMPKRSQTQPLQTQELSPELTASSAQLAMLEENLERLRNNFRTSTMSLKGKSERDQRLLMAGWQELQQQELTKLLEAVKSAEALLGDEEPLAGHSVRSQWQRLRAELEDELQMSTLGSSQTLVSPSAGRLSLGIGSRLSPKKPAPNLGIPKEIAEAAGSFVPLSYEFAKLQPLLLLPWRIIDGGIRRYPK
ncbi:unnamed protein product [Durusdinium trenchii]|uniref:Uncharacterized protein n=1 Tax=Durusdinium trenchii TaxID=1381693 RepID=A0ABP0Q3M5_9DINO